MKGIRKSKWPKEGKGCQRNGEDQELEPWVWGWFRCFSVMRSEAVFASLLAVLWAACAS